MTSELDKLRAENTRLIDDRNAAVIKAARRFPTLTFLGTATDAVNKLLWELDHRGEGES